MLFLQALRASLENRTVDWETDIERETWDALFAMAASHSVLPMIYAAVVRCPAARKADSQIFLPYKRQTMQAVMVQTMKTDAFLRLLPELQAAGVTPIVVNGIICRELYPCLLYTSPSPRDVEESRMPSSA